MVAKTDRLVAELHMRKLWDSPGGILELVEKSKRDPSGVARVLQLIKDNPDYLAKLFPTDNSAESQLKELQKFWKAVYGLKPDLSDVRIPAPQGDISQILVMPKGLTLANIVSVMEKSMRVKVWIDLNKVTSDRNPDRTYAIRIRNRQEADEELKNLSAEDIKQKSINTMTLPERLVYEQFYFWKTGRHLDVKNVTICSASRCVGGCGDVGVPYVGWDPDSGWVDVCRGYLGCRHPVWRARQAVS